MDRELDLIEFTQLFHCPYPARLKTQTTCRQIALSLYKLVQLKLSININKSNYIIFRPRQKRQTFDIKVTLSNRDIIQVKETVFLGVILDEHLTWIPHITNVARKVSKTVGVMYKASLLSPYIILFYIHIYNIVSVFGDQHIHPT